MLLAELQRGVIVRGAVFPEPVAVIISESYGELTKLTGKGTSSGKVYETFLSPEDIDGLTSAPSVVGFDGDSLKFRLGVEALRLGFAYEYDPYFSLSIARVDPLPHQIEAVYHYFLNLPRIRFLLGDDPGAGKTIIAGLLVKELKIRGLVKRVLIVTPANLSFQWQREMKDRFGEQFDVIRGDVLRANYGSNPWMERDQAITSVSWVSRIEDAKESLLRSRWDLIIVDEAHKMSAYASDRKTLAYRLGEELSRMTDHFLLLTATPHKGDPENFRLFLSLLDADVYGDVSSLEEALRRNEAPFYLRRTKEALVTFPDPDTGKAKKIFTERNVDTIGFEIDSQEAEFYQELTDYVERQSIRAATEDSARGRALGFTMALLQRRFASSVYAVRCSLERMRAKRQKILDNPEAHRLEMLARRIPDDFDELPEDEQDAITAELEEVVASIDPTALRQEIRQLDELIAQAISLEAREGESKLIRLKDTIIKEGIFKDPNMKLLIFTEHKESLDYLVAKLRSWKLTVTQIHGGMKIGDRDTPGTRIYAEREFKETAQILVATEAAGEGINLQFCWFMINYDIPWNPIRLEQRMGRIHRYGQEHDCLIFNFVAINTREGRVLNKLLERLKEIRKELGTDQVFDVVGAVFPPNELDKMFRTLYARNTTVAAIEKRIVEQIDVERFRRITSSALESLAKRELNLSAIVGGSKEANANRLVPEVVRDFFLQASPLVGISPKETKAGSGVFRIGRLPRTMLMHGTRLEPRFGKLGREYQQAIFDKVLVAPNPTAEWVTPGHPLFETVRDEMLELAQDDLHRGAVFYDVHTEQQYFLDVYTASIKDGRDRALHSRLFVVQTSADGIMAIRQPTIFFDLTAATGARAQPSINVPDQQVTESALVQQALHSFLAEIREGREREVDVIARHVDISLNELIHRQNMRLGELTLQQESVAEGAAAPPLLAANIKQVEDRLDELNNRLETRIAYLAKERQCTIGDVKFVGRAVVLPHPERNAPGIAQMMPDADIERIAVEAVTKYERAREWDVESVEAENRGFDLISRKPHPSDPNTSIDVRFIEVKGRAGVGEVALSYNEYKTAEKLRDEYWLYVVFNCATKPEVRIIQGPARMGWEPVRIIEHYRVDVKQIMEASE